MGAVVLLSFELVRQYQVRVGNQAAVGGDDVLGDVEPAVVAHDGVEDPEEGRGTTRRLGPRRQPRPLRLLLQLAREHHIEVVEIRLLQAVPEVRDLLGREPRPLPLLVARVVAFFFARARVG